MARETKWKGVDLVLNNIVKRNHEKIEEAKEETMSQEVW
jgi:hypothetical protein